jgi:hypothetical protein
MYVVLFLTGVVVLVSILHTLEKHLAFLLDTFQQNTQNTRVVLQHRARVNVTGSSARWNIFQVSNSSPCSQPLPKDPRKKYHWREGTDRTGTQLKNGQAKESPCTADRHWPNSLNIN